MYTVYEYIEMHIVLYLFHRFHPVYTAMLNMAEAEDTIQPEKYKVEDYPTLRNFPKEHPNKALERIEKDEL